VWWFLGVDGANPLNFSLAVLAHAFTFGLFGLFAHCFQKRIPQWNVLTLPATWVVLEYLRSHLGFLASPWGILGYSQYLVLPVARISAVAGVYGVSFFIVTVNTVLAEIIHPFLFPAAAESWWGIAARRMHKVSLGIFVAAVVLSFAYFLCGSTSLTENNSPPNLKVALIQGNVYCQGSYDLEYRKSKLEKYTQLTLNSADSGPELIAWPSSSVPARIPYDGTIVRILSDLARKTGSFLLVGSAGYDKFGQGQRKAKRVTNSAFLFSPQGKIVGRYDKIRLLPFDEYLPLRGYMKWPSWIVRPDMTDCRPGNELTIFTMDEAKFGVLICWENMFPELFRKMAAKGVDFMVSMTNEAFTDEPAAHHQMLAMNVFRAIENRVSIVRTAPTGVSAIIGPTGRILAKVEDGNDKDVNVEGYLVGQIPLSSNRTFYNRYGDWFVYSLLFVLIGFFLFAVVRKGTPASRRNS
jgi:apolipoprotein N-acyltransferase